MSNTVYNKIIIDGTTYMDLSQDTASSASHIRSGYTAHLNDGTQVTGTYSGGYDMPTFSIVLNANGGNISSVTCDKTYAEALAYMANYSADYTDAAIAHFTMEFEGQTAINGKSPMFLASRANNTIKYYAYMGTSGIPAFQINYASNGTITYSEEPIPYNDSSDLTASGATVTAPAGYYESNATKTLTDANLIAGNIKSGVSIFGVTGNYAGSGADYPKFTITYNSNLTAIQSITCNKTFAECFSRAYDDGDYSAIAELTNGTDTFTEGIAGLIMSQTEMVYYVISESPVASVQINYTSSTLTATLDPIPIRTSTDLTASGATVTAPAGYYESAATKTIASGTAGTPTATKGTVSNHSVSITPSVTNTTGYITGSTKTGTAVTVSASELVSGSETKTANGTYDVTNLAELVVNVSGSSGLEYETGTYTPSSNTAQPTISFANSHSRPPVFVCISDTSSTSGITSSSNTSWSIIDYNRINGEGFPYSTSARRYGLVTYSYRGSNSTTVSSVQIQQTSDETGTSDNTYYRYWATSSAFKPSSTSNSRYWRNGRTYKWIAIWK